jgi:dimeric dUTPase (all-alpha-NTP-PPase superfamily)
MANNSYVKFFLMDKLDKLLKMQRDLSLELASDRYPNTIEQRISVLCTAIIHEAIELQRLTNWKWWKTPLKFSEKEAMEELIDIWHFLLQASIELGMTSEDILDQYSYKNKIHKIRKKQNY